MKQNIIDMRSSDFQLPSIFARTRMSEVTAGLNSLPFSYRYRRDLQKQSNKKRKCYCLRGGLKIANCFGPWDQVSLDVPPERANRDHICNGSFLLSEVRQSTRCSKPTTAKPHGRKYDDSISLGYLSRAGQGDGHLRFSHLESVEEHMRHYRENKPNSLVNQDPDNSYTSDENV